MLREDYPIYFNDTEIAIKRRTWQRGYNNIVSLNQTESGKDDIEFLRVGKTTIKCAYGCTDTWAAILTEFSKLPRFKVKFYDVETKAYVEKYMRMEAYSVTEQTKAERLEVTNGVYVITFNLVEY